MTYSNEKLATRMKVLRAERGWSQQELADRSQINIHSISKYESGNTTPRFDIACSIADAFGVGLQELIS